MKPMLFMPFRSWKPLARRMSKRFIRILPSALMTIFIGSLILVTLMQIAVIHPHRKVSGPSAGSSSTFITSSGSPHPSPSSSASFSSIVSYNRTMPTSSGHPIVPSSPMSSARSSPLPVPIPSRVPSSLTPPLQPPGTTGSSGSPSGAVVTKKKKPDILRVEAMFDRNGPSRDSNLKMLQTFANSARINEIISYLNQQNLFYFNGSNDMTLRVDSSNSTKSSNNSTGSSKNLIQIARASRTNVQSQEKVMKPTERSLPSPTSSPSSSPSLSLYEATSSPPYEEDMDSHRRLQEDPDSYSLSSFSINNIVNSTNSTQIVSEFVDINNDHHLPVTSPFPSPFPPFNDHNLSFISSSHSSSPSSSSPPTSLSPFDSFNFEDTTLGPMNTMGHTLCPLIPPDLMGRVSVNTHPDVGLGAINVHHLNPSVQPGGKYRPPSCHSRHRVAIIIPYRDRLEHLFTLLYHLHPILQRQLLDYQVYVVEQDGVDIFNKGVLMNAGVRESLKDGDFHCFIFHDVDLIPEDDRNLYSCPHHPRHMSFAVDKFNYTLPYSYLVGGVFAISRDHFIQVNGYSNLYWGWGGEDDDMAHRLKLQNLQIIRPPIAIGRYTMIKHDHRPESPNSVRSALLRMAKRRASRDGISSVKYTLVNKEVLPLYTHLMVEISHIHKWHFPVPNKLVLHFR